MIGGEEVRTGDTFEAVDAAPARRTSSPTSTRAAPPRSSARSPPPADAWQDWSRTPWEERAAVFLRAAELLAGPWRHDAQRRDDARPVEDRAPGRDRRRLRADRLLALQRPVHDAHLRGAAGLLARRLEPARVPAARGLRLRRHAVQLHGDRRQPPDLGRADGQHRRLEARVDRGATRAYFADEALRGGRPAARRDQPRLRLRRRRSATRRSRARDLAGIHFTGSTAVFQGMWKTVGDEHRRATATTRASSARPAARTSSSRTRPPTSTRSRPRSCAARSSTRARSARPRRASSRRRTSGRELRERLVEEVGDAEDGRRRRLLELHGRRDRRELVRDAEGGDRGGERVGRRRRRCSSAAATTTREGWFVQPTVIETTDPGLPARCARSSSARSSPRTSTTRRSYDETLDLVDSGAPYGLTGAVFARDRAAIETAQDKLRYAAGNFYVNDKPTGAVVGQQPFGGARASGTNDKAGSMWNLIRWVTPAHDQGDVRAADGLPLSVPRARRTRRRAGRDGSGFRRPAVPARRCSVERGPARRRTPRRPRSSRRSSRSYQAWSRRSSAISCSVCRDAIADAVGSVTALYDLDCALERRVIVGRSGQRPAAARTIGRRCGRRTPRRARRR